MTETLNDRGWDSKAYIEAVIAEDEDAIALAHPFNWLTEEETENEELTSWIFMQLALHEEMARLVGGFYG